MRLFWMPLLLALTPVAASGQYQSIEMAFTGASCAPCLESMPSRAQRIRGVESAVVDAGKGLLKLRLAAENRVRIEQVRDLIEQDGTKATHALVTVKGEIAGNVLRIPGNPNALELPRATAGPVVTGTIENLKPPPGERMKLKLSSAPE